MTTLPDATVSQKILDASFDFPRGPEASIVRGIVGALGIPDSLENHSGVRTLEQFIVNQDEHVMMDEPIQTVFLFSATITERMRDGTPAECSSP